MARTKQKNRKTQKAPHNVKERNRNNQHNNNNNKKKDTIVSGEQNERHEPLSAELTEKFASLIDVEDIAENGFSKDIWVSLSLKEKNSLPAYISTLYRISDGTQADRKRNAAEKHKMRKEVMKHKSYADRQYHLSLKRKFKENNKGRKDDQSEEKEEEQVGNVGVIAFIKNSWVETSDEEKNEWYNSHCTVVRADEFQVDV